MNAHVRRILQETACLDVPVDTLTDHDDLFAAGLSSLGTIRVMMAIEEAFSIQIPDAMITHDLFQSIDALTNVITQIISDDSIATRT
ncbi:acyl carrier protein [Paraburkholderia metrosideri]|jgi:acyl carrier protein|uniref:Aminoacyl carrier protein n=1 Tax=Paraburkholderia metrosideri TaxID=580937 RepID=A0ABM8P1T5_9BURK|nr:acyl carrier protein [Paraburkholderia metrosideri]CAD6553664.1 Aminoacyl carrier protein [Paraburkholderia metrosideri]